MRDFDELDIKTCECGAHYISKVCPKCKCDPLEAVRSLPQGQIRVPVEKPAVPVAATEGRLLSIRIPRIAPSANAFMGRIEHKKWRAIKKKWHRLVKTVVRESEIHPYSLGYPCRICVACYFSSGRKRTDPDNVFVTAKLSLDGLVRAGILSSDSPVYIKSVELCSERSGGAESYTLITVRPAAFEALRERQEILR